MESKIVRDQMRPVVVELENIFVSWCFAALLSPWLRDQCATVSRADTPAARGTDHLIKNLETDHLFSQHQPHQIHVAVANKFAVKLGIEVILENFLPSIYSLW
jgi:hypothetical protein